ncbi:MAG TPA: DUF2064 domain-containing protein, partial [Elusimicrobiales bacterium]|nr:DUF2064 domain-containing protein [Elusimicrobiales bacterium]
MEGNTILLLLSAPTPDRIARGLVDSFGEDRACDVYCEIARASYAAARSISDARTILSYLPNSKYPDLRWLDSEDPGFLQQKGASAGERFYNSVKWCIEAGSTGVAVFSPYAPGVPEQWLKDAFVQLKKTPLVLGPTPEGDCYLIAAAEPFPFLDGYPWEGRKMREELVEAAKKIRMEPAVLPEFYEIKSETLYKQWQVSLARTELFPAAKPSTTARQ